MKTIISLVLLSGVVILAGNFGNVDSTRTADQRMRNMIALGSLSAPYTWMDTVNVSGGNYGVPDTVKVCEVRFLKRGTYQIKLTRSGSRPYVADTNDILRLDLDTIFKVGTDSLSRVGSIRLFGVRE